MPWYSESYFVIAEADLLKQSSDAGKEYGENLCLRSKEPTLCVRDWYSECEKFDYDDPGFSPYTRHFTALIWKGAKEMGFEHQNCRSHSFGRFVGVRVDVALC